MCSVQHGTALYHAAGRGHTHMVQLLLSKGANVNIRGAGVCALVRDACTYAHASNKAWQHG